MKYCVENINNKYWSIFLRWMKNNQIYTKFYFNFYYDKKWCNTYFSSYPLKYRCHPQDWISFAFKWHESKEGSDFWIRKNENWNTYYSKLRNNELTHK